MEKVPCLDVLTLKDLLIEAVYYLKVRCDVPEDLIRRIDKEIEKEVQELFPWTKEWPNESGNYWFYGRRFKPLDKSDRKLELSFVEVRNTAVKDVLMFITRGHILYKEEGAEGWWLKVNIPVLPE